MQTLVKELIQPLELAPDERILVERVCAQWVTLEDILNTAAGPREPIGELLVKAKRIAPAQLDEALADQRQSGQKLGQILVKRGWLSEPELAALLAFQERLGTPGVQRAGPLQLGNLLVTAGDITSEQLRDAVTRHRESNKRIGEVLVDAGYVSGQRIAQRLNLQRALLGVALTAVFMLSVVPGTARANQTAKATAHMRVSANVLPYTRLDVQSQNAMLKVAAEDVARGYVDVKAGTRLKARTNDRNGFSVRFNPRARVFDKAKISGLGNDVEIGPEGGSIHQPYAGPETDIQLSYRFFLADGVAPGDYPWPVQISAAVTY